MLWSRRTLDTRTATTRLKKGRLVIVHATGHVHLMPLPGNDVTTSTTGHVDQTPTGGGTGRVVRIVITPPGPVETTDSGAVASGYRSVAVHGDNTGPITTGDNNSIRVEGDRNRIAGPGAHHNNFGDGHYSESAAEPAPETPEPMIRSTIMVPPLSHVIVYGADEVDPHPGVDWTDERTTSATRPAS